MTDVSWLGASTIVLFAAVLQAITGFGFALIAMPFLLLIVPPQVAVAVSMSTSLACLILLSWGSRKQADSVAVKWLAVGSVFGIPLGAYMLGHADVKAIKTLASVVALVIAVYYILKPKDKDASLPGGISRIGVYLFAGAIAGFLTTSVSMPGPPVVLALSRDGLLKRQFRATSTTFFVLVYVISAFTLILTGVFTSQVVMFVATLIPVAILGNRIGDRIFNWVPQSVFEKLIPALLTLTALNNIIRR